jgi:hypothetical protein
MVLYYRCSDFFVKLEVTWSKQAWVNTYYVQKYETFRPNITYSNFLNKFTFRNHKMIQARQLNLDQNEFQFLSGSTEPKRPEDASIVNLIDTQWHTNIDDIMFRRLLDW